MAADPSLPLSSQSLQINLTQDSLKLYLLKISIGGKKKMLKLQILTSSDLF